MNQYNSTLDAAASATKDEIFIDHQPSTLSSIQSVIICTALHCTIHTSSVSTCLSPSIVYCICAAAPKQVVPDGNHDVCNGAWR